uniref:LIN1-like protein n=1 Tax=Lygus hesperus TaxID=30085 RepID=A0A0A9XWT7_LYGHE
MPKRKHPGDDAPGVASQPQSLVKNSLDSDEEDNDSDDDRYALKDDDIEGQEDGVVGLDEGITITPFNMKEEMEEGHFDNDGMYHWKKEKLAKDHWLDNIDWVKVKESEKGDKALEDDDDMPEVVDIMKLYREILPYLQPKESITQALKRLGGTSNLSASERLKRKKAGLPFNTTGDSEKVSTLTGLANSILTHAGNMDIYQETYENIFHKVNVSSKAAAEPELDMYADDFEDKEKERLADGPATSSDAREPEKSHNNEVMWEYKKSESDDKFEGPFTSAQMEKWSNSGHFGKGVLCRKCGTDQLYTSNRIDFDLYI